MSTKHRLTAPFLPLLAVALLLVTACGPGENQSSRAASSLTGGKVVIVGARPDFPAHATPTPAGFLEAARWSSNSPVLQLKGWAPLDVRAESVRFVLRDPFDQLLLYGTPDFAPQERADVAAAHPQSPEMLHAGFTASLRVTNLPTRAAWLETLELYVLDGAGVLTRLARTDAPQRISWDRRPDRFEIALTYREPALTVAEKTRGNIDVCEANGPHVIRVAGWADFDGQAPGSTLILQVPPSGAPASIISAVWVARPDVRALVGPDRAELDRCGFDLLVEVPGVAADLCQPGALRLWSIDAASRATAVALPAFRKK